MFVLQGYCGHSIYDNEKRRKEDDRERERLNYDENKNIYKESSYGTYY